MLRASPPPLLPLCPPPTASAPPSSFFVLRALSSEGEGRGGDSGPPKPPAAASGAEDKTRGDEGPATNTGREAESPSSDAAAVLLEASAAEGPKALLLRPSFPPPLPLPSTTAGAGSKAAVAAFPLLSSSPVFAVAAAVVLLGC